MTRSEHLQWCKDRAIEYLDKGDQDSAVGSMMSDLTKHLDLEDHIGIQLGLMLMVRNQLNTDKQIRDWILGFN